MNFPVFNVLFNLILFFSTTGVEPQIVMSTTEPGTNSCSVLQMEPFRNKDDDANIDDNN